MLVATIQEVKDRVSQIEYIFCSQLYPNIQKSSKSFQQLYSEAKSAAENEWKERQSELELQMKQLCLEKEKVLDECKASKAEKSRLLTRIAELEDKLSYNVKEVDDGLELHAKLLDLIEVKTVTLRDKERQIKEHEERVKLLVIKSEELEGNINALNKKLQEKNGELTKEKELTKELQRQIESQELKITTAEQMLSDNEEEKKEFSVKLKNMEASLDGLRNELRIKIAEADEKNQLQEKLVLQLNSYGTELTKKNQQLSAHEREKHILLSRVNHLQNKGKELQESLREGSAGVTDIRDPRYDLAKQVEQKTSELAAERQRLKDYTTAYKKLKSQHCFLLKKFGLADKDLLLQMKEEYSDPLKNDETNITLSEIKKKIPVSNVVACELNKVKQEIKTMECSDDEKLGRLDQSVSSKSLSGSDSPTAIGWTTSRNLGSLAGGKRPGSGWRETRSRQSPGGPDPHDDFLDTPYENIRGNLHKTSKDRVRGVPAEHSKGMNSDEETQDMEAEPGPKRQHSKDMNSDDETQDMKAEPGPKRQHSKDLNSDEETQDMKADPGPKRQQLQAPTSGPKGFKYVEPVRKKAERQDLNGVECKQCKKFYDAVLPDVVSKNGEVSKQNFRCEHHDGVSRHRYRYVPPMTPEGFWNIGFDSET